MSTSSSESSIKLTPLKRSEPSINKPNGRSSQSFYFTKPYEPKHAIGIKYKKFNEFSSRDGINKIDSFCKYYDKETNNYGKFVISGRPNAVDKLMIEIQTWLATCQTLHYDQF